MPEDPPFARATSQRAATLGLQALRVASAAYDTARAAMTEARTARREIEALRAARARRESAPAPLAFCPFCGARCRSARGACPLHEDLI